MRPRLRIFRGDDAIAAPNAPEVTIQLEELLRILEDGLRWERSWLRDFASDEVRVSADLYDVITAYGDMRPSA